MPTLTIEHNGTAEKSDLKGRVLIGRRETNHVVIDHPDVSRIHAWIDTANGRFCVTDAGSRTGTLLNGQPVEGKWELKDGDRIAIGPAKLTFHAAAPAGAPAGGPTAAAPPRPRAGRGRALPSAAPTLPNPPTPAAAPPPVMQPAPPPEPAPADEDFVVQEDTPESVTESAPSEPTADEDVFAPSPFVAPVPEAPVDLYDRDDDIANEAPPLFDSPVTVALPDETPVTTVESAVGEVPSSVPAEAPPAAPLMEPTVASDAAPPTGAASLAEPAVPRRRARWPWNAPAPAADLDPAPRTVAPVPAPDSPEAARAAARAALVEAAAPAFDLEIDRAVSAVPEPAPAPPSPETDDTPLPPEEPAHPAGRSNGWPRGNGSADVVAEHRTGDEGLPGPMPAMPDDDDEASRDQMQPEQMPPDESTRDGKAPDPARPRERAQVCGVCQSDISVFEDSTACPECGLRFHADCWVENYGCSAYGCPQVNVLRPEGSGPAASDDSEDASAPLGSDAARELAAAEPAGAAAGDGTDVLAPGGPPASARIVQAITGVDAETHADTEAARDQNDKSSAGVARAGKGRPGGKGKKKSQAKDVMALAAPVPAPSAVPWEHAMLGASVVAGLVSTMTFGVPSLAVCVWIFVHLNRLRGKRKSQTILAAAILGFVGVVLGLVVSCFWHFGVPT